MNLLSKTLSRDGIYTWYTFAREILAEFDINEEDLFVLDKPFKLIKNLTNVARSFLYS
jgi:hypothetical protein